ncbi:m7GpppX diphosphatase [Toxorhynchites rutilus septentrionalis]|uniref:m7GpppX diphosphatase n=1 Tax=Toxorhynchites rutilus septentrionalis TaxID=329112 RepID=UPI00247A6827|nr:m7GpppX diphosphatase [Toxorhynchites rutilus septentrionalis]
MLETADKKQIESVETSNSDNRNKHERQGQSAASSSESSPVVVVDGSSSISNNSYDLAYFEPTRILCNNSTHKTVTLLGQFRNLSSDNYAIVVLEKTAFAEVHLKKSKSVTTANSVVETSPRSESERNPAADDSRSFFSSKSLLRTEFINDIYGNFTCLTDAEINQLKVTIIYPASEKHILKYSSQTRYLVEETAKDYQTVTLPHLEQEQLSLEWLYNILEHRKEQERIVFEDPSDELGFILLPDLKWDGKTLEQLYLLALVRQKGIKSLRDLTATHLPLLRNIRDCGTKAISERFGIASNLLRIYLHYQPSFYHLHVHFTYLKHDPPGIQCEKSHLLSTVIENIELLTDYYQKVTLSCVLNERDKLYEKLVAAKNSTEEPECKRAKIE